LALRIAMFADIHANRQAFSACLAQARDFGAEQNVFLGDYVGYGADPEWALGTVMQLVEKGAMAVRGNHDDAVDNADERLNVEAQVAIEWTRGVLGPAERRFLEELPLTLEEEERLYVHADASSPKNWRYVTNGAEAVRSMNATSAQVTFCGHVHRPALYTVSATGKVTAFTPITGAAVQLLPGRRWLAVLGSVGQPRDRNPAASYLMLDTQRREVTYCRAPYDVEAAAAKIRKAGLPTALANRLLVGR
jgi:diadenosine tetraphosphatase ApaH/serine/threonine PP2A family protein phosphatase